MRQRLTHHRMTRGYIQATITLPVTIVDLTMKTWIFQANPIEFDIDSFLVAEPVAVAWTVTRHQSEIAVGDQVFLWRSVGGRDDTDSGIVAEAVVTSSAEHRVDDGASRPFWRIAETGRITDHAVLRLVRVASKREVLRCKWLREDPILRDLTILKMSNETSYKISSDHAMRLNALWLKTGNDWNRAESIAGLWAYLKTHGIVVSKLPGSPVATVAQLIGRAVGGVYNKVMNFRALDPRDSRKGMTGGGDTDRKVWDEFFDVNGRKLREQELEAEFAMLWGAHSPDNKPVDEAEAITGKVTADASRLAVLSLEELVARYEQGKQTKPKKPKAKPARTRLYERDPLVVAIAKKRADFRCEVPNCQHPVFYDSQGTPYSEVHHLIMLADGGEDSLDNVACLCPGHHREIHFGAERGKLTSILIVQRASCSDK